MKMDVVSAEPYPRGLSRSFVVMSMLAFVHGILICVSLNLPVGPQDLLILQQAASLGSWRRAVPMVVAAALADSAMILAVVPAISLIGGIPEFARQAFLAGGILFLVHIGWIQWRSRRTSLALDTTRVHAAVRRRVCVTVAISALNPHSILDLFSVVGPTSLSHTGVSRWLFMAGCLVNSWLWFMTLAWIGERLGRITISGRAQRHTARLSACALWACAGYLAVP